MLAEHIIRLTVTVGLKRAVARRGIKPLDIDWFLPHYSSEFFRDKVRDAMAGIGFDIPYEKWFTNIRNSDVRGGSMKQERNPLYFSLTAISGLLLICFHVPCVYAEHDTSLRTDINFNYKINDQWRSVSYVFFQANQDISNYDYFEWATGLLYQTPRAWLSFLLSYQQGYSKLNPDNWSLEQRPSISMNTSATFYHFKVSNQIRYEHRFSPGWNDYRIKNTVGISRPDIFLQPYIGWELYYENSDKAFMLNRIKLGIVKNIDNNISIGPYFRVDFSNINHQWEWTRQLIGFQLNLNY